MTKNDVVKRIKDMQKRPEMWAWSEEAFILQVGLLLEVAGLSRNKALSYLLGVTVVNNLAKEITPKRAKVICLSALGCLT